MVMVSGWGDVSSPLAAAGDVVDGGDGMARGKRLVTAPPSCVVVNAGGRLYP